MGDMYALFVLQMVVGSINGFKDSHGDETGLVCCIF